MKQRFGQKYQHQDTGKSMRDHYSLKNQQNGLVMGIITLGYQENYAIIWQPDGGLTQTFCFEKAEDGFYIKSKKDKDLYLTVQNQSEGARIYAAPKNKQDKRQIFKIQKKQNQDSFMITTFCNKVIELSHGGTDKGTHIVQGEKKDGKYQYWRLTQPKPMIEEEDQTTLDVGNKANIQQAKQGEQD